MYTNMKNRLLIEAIEKYGLMFGNMTPDQIKENLGDMSYSEDFQYTDFEKCYSLLIRWGNIIDSDERRGYILAIVKSGLANMNPSIVAMTLKNGTIHIEAAAKEGLFHQNTAKKIVSQFKEKLG